VGDRPKPETTVNVAAAIAAMAGMAGG